MGGTYAAAPDGGTQAWLRVGGFFLISFWTLGVQYAQGLMVASWIDAFGESRARTASVASLCTGVMEAFAVVTGILIQRFGERRCCFAGGLLTASGLLLSSAAQSLWHLHLSYGVLVGCGHSMALFSGIVLMNQWFSSKKATATGLGNCGAGVGTLVFAGATTPLVASAGWRGYLQVLALSTGVCLCAVSALMTKPPARGDAGEPRSDAEPPAAEDQAGASAKCVEEGGGTGVLASAAELWRIVKFRRVAMSMFTMGFALFVPPALIVKYGRDAGHTVEEADQLVMYIGLGSIIMRVLATILADRVGRSTVAATCLFLFGAANILAVWAVDLGYVFLCCFAFWCGGSTGTLMSIVSPLVADIVPMRRMTLAVTSMYTCLVFGFVSGAPIAGFLFDKTGSMDASFIFLGSVLLLAACFLVSIIRMSSAPKADAPEDGAHRAPDSGSHRPGEDSRA